MGHNTEDLTELSKRTVVEPMKKLAGEFPQIQVRNMCGEILILSRIVSRCVKEKTQRIHKK